MNKEYTPRIAIYMSCYNHEKYVAEAMDSIIGQTYENWELYVVNDGSTDRTGDILASYQDKRIHFFDFKINTKFIGAIKFLTKLCLEADVDYIAALASDDIWEKNKLEKQVDLLKAYPEYKACFTWDKVIFSTPGKEVYPNGVLYSHKTNRNRYEWLEYFYRYGNCMNECSLLMDKEVFREFGGKNQNYYQLADFHLWYLFCTKYPFYILEEELVRYRRHETNLSNSSLEVVTRDLNERYQMEKELIMPMDKRTFRRAYYLNLPYVVCDTEEELLAEKFIFFASETKGSRAVREQVAIDIYFEHCRNEKFISILENNYFYFAKDFVDLTGKGGLITLQRPEGKKVFSPAFILLNALDAGKVTEYNVDMYRYSTMFDLWDLTTQYEGGKQQFERIKDYIAEKQAQRKKTQGTNRVLFMVAQSSLYDFSIKLQEKQKEGAECYIAFIPSRKELILKKYIVDVNEECLEGAEVLTMCNKDEHCLYFLQDINKEVDCIYYVDCIDDRYECNSMAAGYPLSVEYHCILNEGIYQNLIQNDKKILAMMKSVEVYGGDD